MLKRLNDHWDDIAPYLPDCNDTLPLNQRKEMMEKIRKYYLESESVNSSALLSMMIVLQNPDLLTKCCI
jgi:hypothetical protein